MSSPVRVYAASSPLQAHALRNMLEDNGIQTRVFDQSFLESGGGFSDNPEIVVEARDAQRAREILMNWERESRESTSLKSVQSMQFGLIGILANITAFACVFAIAGLAKDNSAMPIIWPAITGIVFANLTYIGYYRRKRQTFIDEEVEPITSPT